MGVTLFAVGTVFWIVALALMIRDGARHRTVAMPVAAICSNLAYHIYFGFVCPVTACTLCPYGPCGAPTLTNTALLWTWRCWFVLQLAIFVQLLRWGRERAHEVALPRRLFVPAIAALLVLFYLGQATYVTFYQDYKGNVVTYVSNLMMSALYLPLLFARPRLDGLSDGAAWCKMLGTAFQAVALHLTRPEAYPGHQGSFAFIYFLFGAIFTLDCLYIGLLARRRRAARSGG